MVSSKEILEKESSFCLLLSEQLSALKVFLFLEINCRFSHNQSVLPVRQFGGDVDVGTRFLEILPRTVWVLTGHEEGGEDVPELVLTGPVREGEGCDEPGREILDKLLSLQKTGMIAVADPVAGAPLTARYAGVLPSSLQLRHPLPGEESCPRCEDTHLELASLTRQRALASPPPPAAAAGVDPGRLAGVRAGPVRGGETAGTLLAHVNLPLVERFVMDQLQDRLVAGTGGQLQQHHVVRVAVLEHSVPPHPSLTDLPHLLRCILPGGEGGESEGAVGGVQVELVQHEGDSVTVQRLQTRKVS